jgi:hypothetical protein
VTARAPGFRRLAEARVANATFAVVAVLSIPLLAFFGRDWWFWADDWDFLAARTGGDAGDLFRGHYQHWTTLPILAYRGLWFVFGIRSYLPYQLLVIAAHIVAVALLRVVMRRAGVSPWMATLVALVFLFFGAGAENILIAFQITFVGSLVFGLVQLLLADHEGAWDRRDWLGLVAGFAGLMCSGVAVAMTIVVGVAMLLRRGWRIALLHTAPLAIAYGIWSLVSPDGSNAGVYRTQSPLQVIKFMAIGAASAFGRLGQVPGLGIVLAAVLVLGLAWTFRDAGLRALRGRLALPAALLIGGVVFLLVTGLLRSGQVGPIAESVSTGPARARESRYVYPSVAMARPALALAADAIARRRRVFAVAVIVILLAGVPGNVRKLSSYTQHSESDRDKFRAAVLEAPRLPRARELPRDTSPAAPKRFSGLTLGWLIASLPSGRIPAPPHLTDAEIGVQMLRLALRPARHPATRNCRRSTDPVEVVLGKRELVTLKSGLGLIEYVAPDGTVSLPDPFQPKTLRAIVDSFRVRVQPLGGAPIVVCNMLEKFGDKR